MGVSNYNSDPNANTSISGINIAEGCPPSGINNAIRQIMADVKVADGGYIKTDGNQNISGGLTVSGDVTGGTAYFASALVTSGITCNGGILSYKNTGANAVVGVANYVENPGEGTYNQYDLELRATRYGNRGLYEPGTSQWILRVDSANSPTFSGTAANASSLGGVAASSYAKVEESGSNYIRYGNGLQICWGNSFVQDAASGKDIVFPAAFSATPEIILSPRPNSASSRLYNAITYPRSASGFTAYLNDADGHISGYFSYIAIGKWS